MLDIAGVNSFNNANGWADGTYNLAAGGANGVTPESRHQLVIVGDSTDRVVGSGWGSTVGTVSYGGSVYDVYNQGLAQLLIQQGNTAVQKSLRQRAAREERGAHGAYHVIGGHRHHRIAQ